MHLHVVDGKVGITPVNYVKVLHASTSRILHSILVTELFGLIALRGFLYYNTQRVNPKSIALSTKINYDKN